MNAQELLTAPAWTLTRKQRKDRAALKRQLAETMRVPPGYALCRVRVPDPLPPGAYPHDSSGAIGAAWGKTIELVDVPPRGGQVMVRMLDQDHNVTGKTEVIP
jgi:hypothetical protein